MTKTQKAALFDWIVSNPRFRLEEWHMMGRGVEWRVYLDSNSDTLIAKAPTPEQAILYAKVSESVEV